MQLVLIAHGRRAAFQVAHRGAFGGDDQGALELAGLGGVDAKVSRQFHRAAHARRHVDEGAVGEHRRIQRREKIIARRHHAAEIAFDEFRVIAHRIGERTENDPGLAELFLEGRRHRHAVEHRVHRDAGEARALVQRNAELGVGREQFRIHLIEALRRIRRRPRRRVIGNVLVVDGLVVHMRPGRLLHGLPVPECLQPPVEQKLRLVLLLRNGGHDIFIESRAAGCRTRYR